MLLEVAALRGGHTNAGTLEVGPMSPMVNTRRRLWRIRLEKWLLSVTLLTCCLGMLMLGEVHATFGNF